MVAPNNNAPRATQAEAEAPLGCSAHGCTRTIKTGVLVHKKYVLLEPVHCKACLSRGQKKHFIIPPLLNRDPSFYKLPYAAATNTEDSSYKPAAKGKGKGKNGDGGALAKSQQQVARLQKELQQAKGNPTSEGDQPDESEHSLEELQQAFATLKGLKLDTVQIESEIAATKSSQSKATLSGCAFSKI